MAPRLNKRQQRQQEELIGLTGPLHNESDRSSEEEDAEGVSPTPPIHKHVGGFAALAQAELEQDEQESSEPQQATKAKKSRKKKKKSMPGTPTQLAKSDSVEAISDSKPKLASEKSTPKKTKSRDKTKSARKKSEDLDQILAELAIKHPEYQHAAAALKASSSKTSEVDQQMNHLLAVSIPNLDSDAELRRFFGSKVVNSSKASESRTTRRRGPVQNIKSNLTKPQSNWWSAAQREGLSIRVLSPEELTAKVDRGGVVNHDERWWTVEYSKKYRGVTKAFISAVMSGDPEQFWNIIRILPWHADTLLQLSEVYRHQDEHAQSVDFLNRAIFTYERSFIGAFTFATGANRLDFDRVECRPFYLALTRMITDLQRRGCTRTAFEFARLMLSLDPYSDPQGAYFFLDYLAIRANMGTWLLEVWDLHASQSITNQKFNVTALPGWTYARALALRAKEGDNFDHEGSTTALTEAMLAYPSVLPVLADKADISLPDVIRSHPSCRIQVDSGFAANDSEALLHLLSHLYVQRAHTTWKVPENAAWLKAVAGSVASKLEKEIPPIREKFYQLFPPQLAAAESSLALSIFRHCLQLDHTTSRRFMAFFPKSVMAAPNMSCDPLPPKTQVSIYDHDFFTGAEDPFAYRPRTRRQQEMDNRILDRMIPDAGLRDQLQQMFQQNAGLRERFPGGLIEFLRMEPETAEELLEQMTLGNVQFDPAVDFQMPGGFAAEGQNEEGGHGQGGQEDAVFLHQPDHNVHGDMHGHEEADESEDIGEEDDIDEEDIPAFPVRVLRNLVNRFWGGGNRAQEGNQSDTDEESAAELRDDIGID